MKNPLDDILKEALTPMDEPDVRLKQSIINQVKERETMKKRTWKKIPAAALAAAIAIGCASVAVAAGAVVRQYLSGRDVVQKLGEPKLAEAFSGEDAIFINETQSYGGYDVTLLGIASGKELSKYPSFSNETELKDRTYVVVAIANADGTPMLEEEEYPYGNFYISPFVRDFNPLFLNTYSLNGSGSAFSEDGVRYYLEACDNVEIFADHGLYLCVCGDVRKGNPALEKAYCFDEETGIISRNEEYKGLNALFDLPVDVSKADPEAAEDYLRSDEMLADKFLGIPMTEASEQDLEQSGYVDKHTWRHQITPENIDEYADRLEDSVQVLTPDEDGFIHYEYKGSGGGPNVLSLFEAEEKFIIRGFGFSSKDPDGKADSGIIETLQANEDGTVTVAYYQIKQSVLETLENE